VIPRGFQIISELSIHGIIGMNITKHMRCYVSRMFRFILDSVRIVSLGASHRFAVSRFARFPRATVYQDNRDEGMRIFYCLTDRARSKERWLLQSLNADVFCRSYFRLELIFTDFASSVRIHATTIIRYKRMSMQMSYTCNSFSTHRTDNYLRLSRYSA